MMTRRFVESLVFALALSSRIGNHSTFADEQPSIQQPVRWIEVSSIGHEVIAMKNEISLDAETAATLFLKESPHLCEGWENKLPSKVEDVNTGPPMTEDLERHLDRPRNRHDPYASVLKFSERELIVVVIEYRGNHLWHRFYECKARLRVPRNAVVDEIFHVAALGKRYGTVHKGLKQGDGVDDVKKTLGEPDARIGYQPVVFYKLCYFKDNIIISIKNDRIESFDFGVSQQLKDEVRKKRTLLEW